MFVKIIPSWNQEHSRLLPWSDPGDSKCAHRPAGTSGLWWVQSVHRFLRSDVRLRNLPTSMGGLCKNECDYQKWDSDLDSSSVSMRTLRHRHPWLPWSRTYHLYNASNVQRFSKALNWRRLAWQLHHILSCDIRTGSRFATFGKSLRPLVPRNSILEKVCERKIILVHVLWEKLGKKGRRGVKKKIVSGIT